MATTIRVGTASPSTQTTTASTIAHLATIARRAASQHIDILLLPEAFIGGYPRGTAFGCVIGDRSAQGRDEFVQYFEKAVDLGDTVGDGGAGAGQKWVKRELGDGETQRGDGTREELEGIAAETGVFIVTGCVEKAGGSLYCAVVYVCPRLGMIGKRRKVMPTGTERLIWAQASPSTLRAVSTTIRGIRVNLAAAICWENYMPLVRQALYSQNINLYLAPTADHRDAWLSLMRTIGIEGRCFVVSSNMCVKSGDASGSTAAATTTATTRTRAGSDGIGGRERGAAGGYGGRRARRNSTFTEDGFEIALPVTKQRLNRRKSVFDEDGNEIILCCNEEDDDDDGDNCSQQPSVNGTISPGQTRSLPSPNASSTNAPALLPSFVSRGGSCIISPFGDALAGPQWEDDEGIIYADIDFRECIKGRLDLDLAGSYSRNDSFKFSVEGLDLDPLPY